MKHDQFSWLCVAALAAERGAARCGHLMRSIGNGSEIFNSIAELRFIEATEKTL